MTPSVLPSPTEPTVGDRLRSCRLVTVEFVMPACVGAATADLVAEFAAWVPLGMDRRDDGSFVVSLRLEPGRSWRYRFLLDQERWINDWTADDYVSGDDGQCWSVLRTSPSAR